MPYIQKLSKLCEELGCWFQNDEPLKKHTTFKIGGNARLMIEISSDESLLKILGFLRENNVNFFVIGKGSNILASDSGYDGVILKMSKGNSEIRQLGENEIICPSGVSVSELCIKAMESSLSGLEFAYGIPGTAGGALYMNAGAYGGEIKDIVKCAHYADTDGKIKEINKNDMKLSYRHSIFCENPDMIITDITFSLKAGNREEINKIMHENLQKRKDKQPLEYPSAGSTFKRPEGSYASLLIEECGLKGMSVGDAQVSEKHSGFVINKGNASFKDVIDLTDRVKKIVKEKTGYILELEPIILK